MRQNALPLEWRLRDYAFTAKRRSCENVSMLRKELNCNFSLHRYSISSCGDKSLQAQMLGTTGIHFFKEMQHHYLEQVEMLNHTIVFSVSAELKWGEYGRNVCWVILTTVGSSQHAAQVQDVAWGCKIESSIRQLIDRPAYLILRFQSLLLARPQYTSNSLGVYHSLFILIHFPLPPVKKNNN